MVNDSSVGSRIKSYKQGVEQTILSNLERHVALGCCLRADFIGDSQG